jgi:signal transduction histidine kinase
MPTQVSVTPAVVRVLVVEDDAAYARMLVAALGSDAAWRVTTARRWSEAATLLHAGHFDVALLDLDLPDSAASDTLQAAADLFPRVPILVLTGAGDEAAGLEAVRAGAQDYLVKGATGLDLLPRTLCHAMARHRILSQLEQDLRDSEARLRRIIERTADGMAVVDAAGQLCFVNPAAEALLGRRATTPGSPLGFDIDRGGRPTDIDIIHPDGTVRVVELRAVDTEWDGAPATLLSLRDITTARRLARDLEASQRRRLDEKNEFLSHVSHELRSPLAAVIQFVTMVAEEVVGPVNAEQKEYLDLALRNGRQLKGMIDDLLESARVDAGKLIVSPQWVSLGELTDEVMRTCHSTARERTVALESRVTPDLPLAFADPRRVRAILHNLLDNSLKFTPPGGSIRVEAAVDTDRADVLRVSVVDTGSGIRPDALERVFERLFQESGDVAEPGRGLGLGLFICRELVLAHGGRIWAESEPGRGSTFHFTLPAAPTHASGEMEHPILRS